MATNKYGKVTGKEGIVQPTGHYGKKWLDEPNLPQGMHGAISAGGWTSGNEGYQQQTFLGASIRSFNISAGFGDTSTTMNIDLVTDIHNASDGLGLGQGDDVYHNGEHDAFSPPVVGSPVFFKFGKWRATVEQAFRHHIDQLYGANTWEDYAGGDPDYFSEGTIEEKKRTKDPRWHGNRDRYNIDAEIKPGEFMMLNDMNEPGKDQKKDDWLDQTDLYKKTGEATEAWAGKYHFAFGGILQSYEQQHSTAGMVFNCKLVDPREILENVQLILNNYAGTTFNNKNLFNVYGFLEYEASPSFVTQVDSERDHSTTIREIVVKDMYRKVIDTEGRIRYKGNDLYDFFDQEIDEDTGEVVSTTANWREVVSEAEEKQPDGSSFNPPQFTEVSHYLKQWPITGPGFSRRSENGIPWFRVDQALRAFNGDFLASDPATTSENLMPDEFHEAGFGGTIDFRGYNYVVDFSQLTKKTEGHPYLKETDRSIPKSYFLEYDQISMLDLFQEMAEVCSNDLYISLLPVIDTGDDPVLNQPISQCYKAAYATNKKTLEKAKDMDSPEKEKFLGENLITGVIHIDLIDRTTQPTYGKVKSFIDNLEANGIDTNTKNLGFELSNVVTDKFVVGAQEIDMYFFNCYRDRDTYFERIKDRDEEDQSVTARIEQINHDKWTLDTNLKQQLLPFYGLLDNRAVSIPRGFGSYQQILLDAQSVDAHGLGAYYIATEMELRAAAKGFNNWMQFLTYYNNKYIEELTPHSAFLAQLGRNLVDTEIEGINEQIDDNEDLKTWFSKLSNRDFGVSVPRCVWNSDKNDAEGEEIESLKKDYGFDPTPFFGQIATRTGADGSEKIGIPANPCNPPFGYPLYYGRGSAIGIPMCGFAQFAEGEQILLENIKELQDMRLQDRQRFNAFTVGTIRKDVKQINERLAVIREKLVTATTRKKALEAEFSELEQKRRDIIEKFEADKKSLEDLDAKRKVRIGILKFMRHRNHKTFRDLQESISYNKASLEKIFNLVKSAADNMGKRFLVKLPKYTNVNFSNPLETAIDLEAKGEDDEVLRKNQGSLNADGTFLGNGPFGFKPRPISQYKRFENDPTWYAILGILQGVAHATENRESIETRPSDDYEQFKWEQRSNVHFHYLDPDAFSEQYKEEDGDETLKEALGVSKYSFPRGYSTGALQNNWNPMTETWDFNYLPAKDGGFFNHALWAEDTRNFELDKMTDKEKENYEKYFGTESSEKQNDPKPIDPPTVKLLLAPKLRDKMLTNGNRILPYVKFDNAQFYDFSNVSADKIEMQRINDFAIIPDPVATLPNQLNKKVLLDDITGALSKKGLEKPHERSIAFIACDIDEKLYMPPKTVMFSGAPIYAEKFQLTVALPQRRAMRVLDKRETTLNEDGDEVDNPTKGQVIEKTFIERIHPIFNIPEDGGLVSSSEQSDTEGEEEKEEQGNGGGEGEGNGGEEGGNGGEEEKEKQGNETAKWDDFAREYDKLQDSWLIKTKEKDLDGDHVYALITLPGPVFSSAAMRYADSLRHSAGVHKKAHSMTEDVVKIKEFEYPIYHEGRDVPIPCEALTEFNFKDMTEIDAVQEEINKGHAFGASTDVTNFQASPIYPDMVALPLMSKERCYGPWISSAMDALGSTQTSREEIEEAEKDDRDPKFKKYSEIGGKIEFIKDEKFAPWNYGGYQMMDETAKLFTNFSNSLLLFTEKGTFSHVGAPTGVALARSLDGFGGPLVTSLSVSVGNQITTSVSLDLYTTKFGKLQRQKELAVARITRERQKTIDQNNRMIRKGLMRDGLSMDLFGDLSNRSYLERFMIYMNSLLNDSIQQPRNTSLFIIQNKDGQEVILDEENEEFELITSRQTQHGTMMSSEEFNRARTAFKSDEEFYRHMQNMAGASVEDMFMGASFATNDPNFPSARTNVPSSLNKRIT